MTLTSYMGYVSNQAAYWHDGRNNTPKIDLNSPVSASAGDSSKDPKFVNFGFNTVDLASYTYDSSWNFRVQAASPVLTGAYSSFTGSYAPYWGTTGLTVNSVEYKTPGKGTSIRIQLPLHHKEAVTVEHKSIKPLLIRHNRSPARKKVLCWQKQ